MHQCHPQAQEADQQQQVGQYQHSGPTRQFFRGHGRIRIRTTRSLLRPSHLLKQPVTRPHLPPLSRSVDPKSPTSRSPPPPSHTASTSTPPGPHLPRLHPHAVHSQTKAPPHPPTCAHCPPTTPPCSPPPRRSTSQRFASTTRPSSWSSSEALRRFPPSPTLVNTTESSRARSRTTAS